jgi:hypothetical protein
MATRADGDSQVSGGPVSPGWCFSATGLEIGASLVTSLLVRLIA